MISLVFFFLIIIPSAIIHEFFHAWMASYLGDDTAKHYGRLSLNPLVHIDMFGTILMPIFLSIMSGGRFLFAYAKPVPFNPYNLRNQKYGPALVGLAGPLANLLLALCFGLVFILLPIDRGIKNLMASLIANHGPINGIMMVFSTLPAISPIIKFSVAILAIIYANILLMVFNLVPIPPLDGSKILEAILPNSWSGIKYFLERYGFLLLLFFLFFAFQIIIPIITFIYSLIVGVSPLGF